MWLDTNAKEAGIEARLQNRLFFVRVWFHGKTLQGLLPSRIDKFKTFHPVKQEDAELRPAREGSLSSEGASGCACLVETPRTACLKLCSYDSYVTWISGFIFPTSRSVLKVIHFRFNAEDPDMVQKTFASEKSQRKVWS